MKPRCRQIRLPPRQPNSHPPQIIIPELRPVRHRRRLLQNQPIRNLPPQPALQRRKKIRVGGKDFLNGLVSHKMNLRRKTPPDSLYLLLDTLCNAFGGIILLAVLVVLLTSKEKSQGSNASEFSETTQRRLALAQTNLQASAQLAASLQAK